MHECWDDKATVCRKQKHSDNRKALQVSHGFAITTSQSASPAVKSGEKISGYCKDGISGSNHVPGTDKSMLKETVGATAVGFRAELEFGVARGEHDKSMEGCQGGEA